MKGFVGVPITLALVLIGVKEIDMVPEAMKQLTHGFLKVLEECKTEVRIYTLVVRNISNNLKKLKTNFKIEQSVMSLLETPKKI